VSARDKTRLAPAATVLAAAATVLAAAAPCLLAAALLAPCTARAALPTEPPLRAELASAETAIAVEAGLEAPRLRSLRLRGAPPWLNGAEETLPPELVVHGAARPVRWHLDRSASRIAPRDIALVYVSDVPQLRLIWRWRARADAGPLEHSILIENSSSEPVGLALLPSLRFDWAIPPQVALQRFWVEKGADTPSAEGTHWDALRDGDTWMGHSSTYARPAPGKAREMIPYVLIEDAEGAGRGWYLGIESSARTRITLARSGASLSGKAGLDADADEQTRIAPHGSFEAPTIFLGASTHGPDGAGNVLKRWVRAVLNNPRTVSDPRYPLLVSNSWGSGMAIDEPRARQMILSAAELGLEMFHLDAGWFRDVGDWHADPRKFPHGIAGLADLAHEHGLKFGLWMDWTQAGTSTRPGALNVHDPVIRDWLIADPPAGWRHGEPFKGITLDLGVPAVQAWAGRELERVVRDYHLDMLEHDGYLVAQGSSRANHPAMPPDPASLAVYEDAGFLWADGSNATDVSYHATLGYYSLYRRLRAHHPSLLLEVCNDGGRMVDFGSAAHGDYFSMTDTYDPLSNRRAFYDASYVLPPAMLESYVEKWPAPHIENFRYQLRSGMLGWFSLMLDSREWTREQRAAARREFALYKSSLRPLIRDADLYHVAGRPDGIHWDGIEYYSAPRRRGVLYAFRGSADQAAHRYRLQGLDPRKRYRLEFEDRGKSAERMLAGRFLMRTGVEVTLPLPLSSELIFIKEIS
jgi:hypothetical protein